MNDTPDIDLDVADQTVATSLFDTWAVPASLISNNTAIKHPAGLYLQRIPVNPLNGFAAFPTKHAEQLGYYKFDILTNTVYRQVASMEELRRLLGTPVDWTWFETVEFVRSLVQLGGEAELVATYRPRSIADLACLVAIIRPGKRYLIGQSWELIREKIWQTEPASAGRTFKKSHSLAYSLLVGVDARIKAPKFFAR